MNLEHESRSYQTTGQSGAPQNASNRMSSLVAIRPLREFLVERHLVQPSSYPPKLVLKLPKGFLSQNNTSMQNEIYPTRIKC